MTKTKIVLLTVFVLATAFIWPAQYFGLLVQVLDLAVIIVSLATIIIMDLIELKRLERGGW